MSALQAPALSQEERIFLVLYYCCYETKDLLAKFAEEFPYRHPPSKQAVDKLIGKFCQTGSVLDLPKSGRPSAVTPEIYANIKKLIDNDASLSYRKLAAQVGLSKETVRRVTTDILDEWKRKNKPNRPSKYFKQRTAAKTLNAAGTSSGDSNSSWNDSNMESNGSEEKDDFRFRERDLASGIIKGIRVVKKATVAPDGRVITARTVEVEKTFTPPPKEDALPEEKKSRQSRRKVKTKAKSIQAKRLRKKSKIKDNNPQEVKYTKEEREKMGELLKNLTEARPALPDSSQTSAAESDEMKLEDLSMHTNESQLNQLATVACQFSSIGSSSSSSVPPPQSPRSSKTSNTTQGFVIYSVFPTQPSNETIFWPTTSNPLPPQQVQVQQPPPTTQITLTQWNQPGLT